MALLRGINGLSLDQYMLQFEGHLRKCRFFCAVAFIAKHPWNF
jgi:hypothetical protein